MESVCLTVIRLQVCDHIATRAGFKSEEGKSAQLDERPDKKHQLTNAATQNKINAG